MVQQLRTHEEDFGLVHDLIEGLSSNSDPSSTWFPLYMVHLQNQDLHKEVMEVVDRYGSLRLAMSTEQTALYQELA